MTEKKAMAAELKRRADLLLDRAEEQRRLASALVPTEPDAA